MSRRRTQASNAPEMNSNPNQSENNYETANKGRLSPRRKRPNKDQVGRAGGRGSRDALSEADFLKAPKMLNINVVKPIPMNLLQSCNFHNLAVKKPRGQNWT